MMRKNLLILFLCGLFTAGGAEAALTDINGYVCSAMYTRQDHALFGQGYVRLQITSAAGCGGSFLGESIILGVVLLFQASSLTKMKGFISSARRPHPLRIERALIFSLKPMVAEYSTRLIMVTDTG